MFSYRKGFSLGFFDEEFVSNFSCGIVERDGKILGFANILESIAKSELSIDLMRHTDESPHGVMDFLFINLFSWGQENNYQAFSLAMAPLSGLSTNPLAPNYAKIGNVVFRHGGNFYNFEGLRKYKEKFEPTWVPRYLACPNGLYLPIVLSNISVLISGGVKGLIKK
jgi:phosphatidylglycerol lysyltransferase